MFYIGLQFGHVVFHGAERFVLGKEEDERRVGSDARTENTNGHRGAGAGGHESVAEILVEAHALVVGSVAETDPAEFVDSGPGLSGLAAKGGSG
jgi:hypothetical protein